MTELEKLCEQALYEEISVLEDGKSIVRDVPSGRLYFKKRLRVYIEQVFSWLRDHPTRYVPGIAAYWKEDDELIVIEELVQGRTLEEILQDAEKQTEAGKEPDPLPFAKRIDILTQICDGLTFLHDARPPIIHRDLKPSNIMITDDGTVKIIDYDAAKIQTKGEKKDTVLIGTHGIAAPEQYGFASSDVRTDIFAMGKLVERMLPDNVDAARVVERATRMDPEKRFSSAQQMRDQIVRIREQISPLDNLLEKLPGYDPRKRKHRVRARAAMAAIVLLLLAGAAGAAWGIVIYPQKRHAAFEAELATLDPDNTYPTEMPGAVAAFCAAHPYAKLDSQDQKSFRETIRRMLYQSMRKENVLPSTEEPPGSTASSILNVLREADPKVYDTVWNPVWNYSRADVFFARKLYEKGLATLKTEQERGSIDAQEMLAAGLERCKKEAEKGIEKFEETRTASLLKSPLDCCQQIDSVEPSENLYEPLFRKAVATADDVRDEGNYTGAEKIYTLLQEYPQPDPPVDLEEKLKENTYRQGAELLEGKKYKAAAELFEGLGNYQDSKEKKQECWYLYAQTLRDEEKFPEAAEIYAKIPGYKDADERNLEMQYQYCVSVAEDPDKKAYEMMESLLQAGYPGAEAVRDTMYQWHAKVETGVNLKMGSQQAADLRATLAGGPPDASTHIRFELIDHVNGYTTSWTSDESYQRSESCTAIYHIETMEYNIFEREYTVNTYADDGTRIGTWTGIIPMEFLQRKE